MTESMESILAGANTPAQEEKPARIVDEPENLIGTEQVEGQPHPDEVQPSPAADGKVPIGAIRQAEREKGNKRYTEAVTDFEKKLADTDARWEQRFTQLYGALATKSAQAMSEQPAAKPDFWDNPEAATQHAVQPIIGEMRQALMANSQLVAQSVHGQEKVQEAERAFLQAYHSGQVDPADYTRIVNAPNRWDAAVKWHKQRQTFERVGADPEAYEQRVRDEERAKVLAEIQQTGQVPQIAPQTGATTQQVMPSNLAGVRNAGQRGGSTFSGPPPISEILASQKSIFKT